MRDRVIKSRYRGGGVQTGGFPIWTCLSRSVLLCPFWNFPFFFRDFPIFWGFSHIFRRFSRFILCLLLGLLKAPTRTIPERVRNTIRTFPPEKSGKPPGLASLKAREAAALSFSHCRSCPTDIGGLICTGVQGEEFFFSSLGRS